MPADKGIGAAVTTIASFPEYTFLENLAVRRDGSILVTVLNSKRLLTTHGGNTIDRVSLEPAGHGVAHQRVVGDPFTEQLIGPSSIAWSPSDYGRRAYVTTDGGTAVPPPDGVVRPAKVLQIEFAAGPESQRSTG